MILDPQKSQTADYIRSVWRIKGMETAVGYYSRSGNAKAVAEAIASAAGAEAERKAARSRR